MTLGEILIQYRKDHNLSQRQFAAQCKNVTSGYISMVERGNNPSTGKPIIPSIDKLMSFARGMGISLHQLAGMIDDMPVYTGDSESQKKEMYFRTYSVPIIGKTAAGVPCMVEEWNGESLILPDTGVRYDAAMRIDGDSMEPQFHIGDFALVRYQDDVDDGQIAVICLDNEVTMKRIFHMKNAIQLQSDNPKYPTMIFTNNDYNNIHLVGLVVGVLNMKVH